MMLGLLFLSPQRFSTVPRLGGAADSYLASGSVFVPKHVEAWENSKGRGQQTRLFLELGRLFSADLFIRSCRSFPQSKMMLS
jgi:hypothetical protein